MTNPPNPPTPTHAPGRSYPEPDRASGPPPVPEFERIKADLGPTRISPRDLALGLRLGTIKVADFTGRPDTQEMIASWLDDGSAAGKRGKYDPMKVYTTSTNRHDHRTQMRVNMPPDMLRAITMLASMVPQFGSPAGVVRDAIVHSLQHWAQRLDGFIDAEVVNAINFTTMNTVLASMKEAIEERRRVVSEIDELLDTAMKDGDHASVEVICDIQEAMAEHTAEPNRTRMLETVARGRGWLVEWRKQEAKRIAREKVERIKAEAQERAWLEQDARGEMEEGIAEMLDA